MTWDERTLLPHFFHQADESARVAQRTFLFWKGAEFTCLAAAAIFALFSKQVLWGAGPWLTVISFGTAIAIRISPLLRNAENTWYDARAAAESIKTAAWQFAVGGESFRIGDGSAPDRFRKLVSDICRALPSWQRGSFGDEPLITDGMATLRRASRQTRSTMYREHRVNEQTTWYAQKAAINRLRSRLWTVGVLLVEAAALVVGVVNLIEPIGVDLLGAFAAVAAAIVGWQQTKQFNNLAEVYAVTSNEVALVKDSLDESSEEVWAQSVTDAEAAFSREHSMWLSRRQGPLVRREPGL